MKIRWTNGSVRLRITPSEFESLQASHAVSEELSFPNGGHWRAEIEPGGEVTSIAMQNGALHLSLSAADMKKLSAPDTEGVYFNHDDEPRLRYYIEKDFPCAHPRAAEAAEPESETFAPPADFEERKNAG